MNGQMKCEKYHKLSCSRSRRRRWQRNKRTFYLSLIRSATKFYLLLFRFRIQCAPRRFHWDSQTREHTGGGFSISLAVIVAVGHTQRDTHTLPPTSWSREKNCGTERTQFIIAYDRLVPCSGNRIAPFNLIYRITSTADVQLKRTAIACEEMKSWFCVAFKLTFFVMSSSTLEMMEVHSQ